MSTTIEAEDGRIYIPKETREKLGTKFKMIERNDRIILLPVSDDPLEGLRNAAGDIDKSVEELKDDALEEAMEEAGR